jgi:hypothetical protein
MGSLRRTKTSAVKFYRKQENLGRFTAQDSHLDVSWTSDYLEYWSQPSRTFFTTLFTTHWSCLSFYSVSNFVRQIGILPRQSRPLLKHRASSGGKRASLDGVAREGAGAVNAGSASRRPLSSVDFSEEVRERCDVL